MKQETQTSTIKEAIKEISKEENVIKYWIIYQTQKSHKNELETNIKPFMMRKTKTEKRGRKDKKIKQKIDPILQEIMVKIYHDKRPIFENKTHTKTQNNTESTITLKEENKIKLLKRSKYAIHQKIPKKKERERYEDSSSSSEDEEEAARRRKICAMYKHMTM